MNNKFLEEQNISLKTELNSELSIFA